MRKLNPRAESASEADLVSVRTGIMMDLEPSVLSPFKLPLAVTVNP